jgi:putative glycosyltransferase (TIGR04348 family)
VRIRIVTPAPVGSRRGNRVTAERWARVLRGLGHHVTIDDLVAGGPCDLLVALHARKSAAAVALSRREAVRRPIVLALTGTDVYRDIHRSAAARRALALADRLIVLQPLAALELSRTLRRRTRVVYQSVRPLRRRSARPAAGFQVCVLGHLRAVKDPFRAALAARRLPATSRVRIVHLGAALTDAMARGARAEERRNPRYRWLGDVPRRRAMTILSKSHVLVLSSRMEGGANVIGEALAHRVPVIASRIPGSVGLLGPRYPGYFPVGDTKRLAALLARAERDPRFCERLRRAGDARARLFDPSRERAAWAKILRELAPRARGD